MIRSFNKFSLIIPFILYHQNIYQSNLNQKSLNSFANQSSREIDIKINQERWKNLQNNYKALKTRFGLKIPSTITKNYPRPDKIYFNLESLRQCSNQFPQYLLEQLKNEQSKFYEVIDDEMNNLWRAQKKEALEMISFVLHWNLFQRSDDIQQMLFRTLNRMELNLFQIFQVLKWVVNDKSENIQQTNKLLFFKIRTMMENKIILKINIIEPAEYDPLFKILNMFYLYDIQPNIKQKSSLKKYNKQILNQNIQTQQQQNKTEKQQNNVWNQQQQSQFEQKDFFQLIEQNLVKNLDNIPPSTLVIMAVQYANNTKQQQDQRITVLQKVERKIITNLKFLNHEQIIALLYSFIKTSLLSKQSIEIFIRRICLIYHEMNWENKKKILSLSSNFPQHEQILIISECHHEILKGKPIMTKMEDGSIKRQYNPNVFIDIDYQLVPEIYLATYENNLLTEQLASKMQGIILNNIFNFDREEVVRSVWLFTVTPNVNKNLQKLHKKLQAIIQGGLQSSSYSIKEISILVWSLCNSGSKNQQIYKPQAKFWDNLQYYMQQILEKEDELNKSSILNSCSYILWAYAFNRPLKFKTVSLITNILLKKINFEKRSFVSRQHQKLSEKQIEPFQLINIITFYFSLPESSFSLTLINKVKQLCVIHFEKIYMEMKSLQLMKCLKYFVSEQQTNEKFRIVIKLKVWRKIIQIFTSENEQIQYQYIMGIVGFVINSPLGKSHDKKAIHLVNLLMNRKKTLEQLRPMPENEKAKF